jgi:LysR family glycine cleavage system transcriptional activator
MAPPLPPLNALRTFEAAARHRHMGRAARELGVTHGAVSRQVRVLEEHLGSRLFTRTGRGLELTELGRELAERATRIFEDMAWAVDRVSAKPTAAVLRVGAPRAFSTRWLAPRLGGFCEGHPWIDLRVDSSRDEAELGRGEADVSIRFGEGPWPGVVVDSLGEERLFPVCAPSLLHGARPLRSVEDLARHTLLHFADTPDWASWLKAVGARGVEASRGPRFSELTAVLSAAEAGQGIAIARSTLVQRELQGGRLVRLFTGEAVDGRSYFLLTTARGNRRPEVSAFRTWLLRQVGAAREERAEPRRER